MGDQLDSIYRNDPNYSSLILNQQHDLPSKLREVQELIAAHSIDGILAETHASLPSHVRDVLNRLAQHALPQDVATVADVTEEDRRVMRSFYIGELYGLALAFRCLPKLDEFAVDLHLLIPDKVPYTSFSSGEDNRLIREHLQRVATIAEDAYPQLMEHVREIEQELTAADFLEVRLGAGIMIAAWVEQFLEQYFTDAEATLVHSSSSDADLWAELIYYENKKY